MTTRYFLLTFALLAATVAGFLAIGPTDHAIADPPPDAPSRQDDVPADVEVDRALPGELNWTGGIQLEIYPERKKHRTFFLPPTFNILANNGRPAIKTSGKQLSIEFAAYPPGLRGAAAEYLTERFKASPDLNLYAGEVPVNATQILRLPLRFVRINLVGLQGIPTPPSFRYPSAESAGNTTSLGDELQAFWNFSSNEEAEIARKQVEEGTTQVSIDYGIIGVLVKRLTVEAKWSDIRAEDWLNDVSPGKDPYADNQYFTLEQVGRAMRNTAKNVTFRIEKDTGLMGFPSEDQVLYMIDKFVQQAMEPAKDLQEYDEKLQLYVGKKSFEPSVIKRWLEKTKSLVEMKFDLFVEKIIKAETLEDHTKDIESTSENIRHHIAEGNVKGSIDILGKLTGSADAGGRSDYYKRSFNTLKEKGHDHWKQTFASEMRERLATSLKEHLETEKAGEGELINPKRIKVYRVNKTALQQNTNFLFESAEVTRAGQVVNRLVRIKNQEQVLGKAHPIDTLLEKFDKQLKDFKDDLKKAQEKSEQVKRESLDELRKQQVFVEQQSMSFKTHSDVQGGHETGDKELTVNGRVIAAFHEVVQQVPPTAQVFVFWPGTPAPNDLLLVDKTGWDQGRVKYTVQAAPNTPRGHVRLKFTVLYVPR